MEGQSNNGVYVTKGFSEEVSPSIKRPTNSVNSPRNSFASNLFNNGNVRSFGVPTSTPRSASYETVENTDEELFPYSKKLLDDVNYLLKYVTPTIESKHESKNFPVDFSKNKFLNDDPYLKEKFKDEPVQHKDKFQLPPNFPYQFSKFEEPKFEKLSFNGPNIDENTFIEPSLSIAPKHEEHISHESKFEKPGQENQRGVSQSFDGSGSTEFKYNAPVSGGQHFGEARYNNPRQSFEKINSNFDNRLKYNGPRLEGQRFEKINSNFDNGLKYNVPRSEGQRFENTNFNDRLKFNSASSEGQQFGGSNFDNSPYTIQKSEELKLEGSNFDSTKYDESRLEEQSADSPLQEEHQYNVGNYETPSFDPQQQFNENNFEQPKYESQGFIPSHFEGATPNFNDPKFSAPNPIGENVKQNSQPDPQSNANKVEIPQYIHIHRYEASGEDQTNNARPKELIYYNPLQIPVPNSIAYMEQGSHNYSNPQHVSLTPSYITMTEHPRVRPAEPVGFYRNNIDVPDFASKLTNLTQFHENHLEPTPAQPISTGFSPNDENTYNQDSRLLNLPPQKPATPENVFEDHRNNYENTIGALPPFDPRTYSGYFDFLPSSELESEDEKLASPPAPSYPTTTEQAEQPKNELPQYYYDFSTASPANKYVSSAEASQEQFSAGFDPNQIRNSTFLASAYLRPLHKERVYIHHNSQPTTPSEENFIFPSTTIGPNQPRQREADVQIVKSISSTIPPELLKDFDYQLSSSLFSSRSDDNYDANSENHESKTSSDAEPKLNSNIVKKLQSALAINGKMYLKTPTQNKRVVR